MCSRRSVDCKGGIFFFSSVFVAFRWNLFFNFVIPSSLLAFRNSSCLSKGEHVVIEQEKSASCVLAWQQTLTPKYYSSASTHVRGMYAGYSTQQVVLKIVSHTETRPACSHAGCVSFVSYPPILQARAKQKKKRFACEKTSEIFFFLSHDKQTSKTRRAKQVIPRENNISIRPESRK